MKKLKNLALADKVFLVGFSALSIATFDLTAHWTTVTLAGIAYLVWRFRHAARR